MERKLSKGEEKYEEKWKENEEKLLKKRRKKKASEVEQEEERKINFGTLLYFVEKKSKLSM